MIIKSTLWLLVSYVVGRVFSLFWQFYLARYYTGNPEQYGYFMLLMTQYTVWVNLADGNLVYAVQQFVASDKDRAEELLLEYWPFIVGARMLLGAVSGLVFISIVYLKYPTLLIPALLMTANLWIYAVGTSPLGLWAGIGDFEPEAKASMLSTPVYIGFGVLATMFSSNIALIIFCNLLGSLASGVFVWRRAVRRWGMPRGIIRSLKLHGNKFFKLCFPLTFASFTYLFFFRGDMLFITDSLGAKSAGAYSIALMFFFLFTDLMWSQLGKAYTPSLISQWSYGEDKSAVSLQLSKLLTVYNFAGILALLFIALAGRFVLALVFGASSPWIATIDPLFWLMIGFVPNVIYGITYRLFVLERGSMPYMWISFIIVSLKFGLAYLFVKMFGMNGAAITSSLLMILFFLMLAGSLALPGRSIFLDYRLMSRTFAPIVLFSTLYVLQTTKVLSFPAFALSIVAVALGYIMLDFRNMQECYLDILSKTRKAKEMPA